MACSIWLILSKALIVYGTRTGTTANTSQVIADTLRPVGYEVKIVVAKKEKARSVGNSTL
jgi:menaquinone-dependent protoporphyrinogen IX oxidase